MTDPDVLDPGVERYLRDAFATDADGAPGATDLEALAGSAVRRSRVRRRRTAVSAAALSVVLVVLAVGVAQQLSPRTTLVPGDGATPTPSPSVHFDRAVPAGPAVEGPSLMFRGVEVPVPRVMLAPEAYRCGTPVKDAAYVRDLGVPIELCAVIPKHPERLTVVVLEPWRFEPGEQVPGTRVLDDGRTQIASRISDREAWLSVTSPDPERAQRLFAGARIVETPDGCPLHAGPVPPETPLTGGPTLIEQAIDGTVCGYRDDWLVGSARLDRQDAQKLSALVAAAPGAAAVATDCSSKPEAPLGSGWWLTLGRSRAWIDAAHDCARVYGGDGSQRFVTEALVSELWSQAVGPGSISGLYGAHPR